MNNCTVMNMNNTDDEIFDLDIEKYYAWRDGFDKGVESCDEYIKSMKKLHRCEFLYISMMSLLIGLSVGSFFLG